MSLYLEQTPPQLEALAQAIRQSDAEVQASIAHTLKSYSLTVGAMALAGTCRNIEAMSREDVIMALLTSRRSSTARLISFSSRSWRTRSDIRFLHAERAVNVPSNLLVQATCAGL